MELQHKKGKGILSEYLCELTNELDILSGLDKKANTRLYHYIIVDNDMIKDKYLPIRVHGGTVGGIWFDENNIITKIVVDTKYVIKTYPENVNDVIQKFVGETIKW